MECPTEKNTSLRVASFSYYLDTAKENSFHKTSPTKLVFNVPDPAPFTFPQEPHRNGEISVFGADKYFSMKVDYPMGMIKNQVPVHLARTASNPGPRAPSFSSEASSCNSQTAMLQRNGSQTKHKKPTGRRIFSGFGCKQPCFNKKDVRTLHHAPKPAITRSRSIMNSTSTVNKPSSAAEADDHIQPARASLEVFGSNSVLKGDVAKNMERKLSILTWDAIIPNPPTNPPFSTVETSTLCDDMASEVSSDLFEIENINSASKHASVCTSPEVSHYAPSEASIQWSVVTGSAADYSAAADGHEERSVRVTAAGDVVMSRNNDSETFGGGRRGILGCRSLRGVDVSESVVCKGKHEGLGLGLAVSLGKSQTNRKR